MLVDIFFSDVVAACFPVVDCCFVVVSVVRFFAVVSVVILASFFAINGLFCCVALLLHIYVLQLLLIISLCRCVVAELLVLFVLFLLLF